MLAPGACTNKPYPRTGRRLGVVGYAWVLLSGCSNVRVEAAQPGDDACTVPEACDVAPPVTPTRACTSEAELARCAERRAAQCSELNADQAEIDRCIRSVDVRSVACTPEECAP